MRISKNVFSLIFLYIFCFPEGTQQNAITIKDFDRKYISFNFKGKGYAQILFQEVATTTNEKAFTVSLGS